MFNAFKHQHMVFHLGSFHFQIKTKKAPCNLVLWMLLSWMILLFGSLQPNTAQAQSFVTVGNGANSLPHLNAPIQRLNYQAYQRFCWSNILLVDSLLATVNLPTGVLIDSVAFFKASAHVPIHSFFIKMLLGPANQTNPYLNVNSWENTILGKKEVMRNVAFDLGTSAQPTVFKFYRAYPYWSGGLQLATFVDYGPFPGSLQVATGPSWVADHNLPDITRFYASNASTFDSTAVAPYLGAPNRMPVVRIYYRNRVSRDLGVRVIQNPIALLPANTPTQVQVEVTNEGTDTLVSANLSYRLQQGTPISQSFNFNLAPDSSVILTFSTPIQVPLGNEFKLNVWLNSLNGSLNDLQPSNDSLEMNLTPIINSDTVRVGQQQDFQRLQDVFDRLMAANNPQALTVLVYDNQMGNFSLHNYLLPTHQQLTIEGIDSSVTLNAAQSGALLLLNNVRGVLLKQLRLQHLTTAGLNDLLVHMVQSEGITLENNQFLGASGSNRNHLVLSENCKELVVQNNYFRHGNQAYHASSNVANRPIFAHHLLNNRFEDQFGTVIRFSGAQQSDSLWIEGNRLFNSQSPENTAAGIEVSNGSRLTIAKNSILGHIGRYGIWVNRFVGDSITPNKIVNNAVSGNFSNTLGSALRLEAINLNGDSLKNYMEVYYNSFQMRLNTVPANLAGTVNLSASPLFSASPWNGLKFRNNLVMLQAPTNTAINAGALVANAAGVVTGPGTLFSHNHYHAPGHGVFSFHLSNQREVFLSSWQANNPNSELFSRQENPLVFNAPGNDLRFFINSTLRASGVPITDITTDIMGNSRGSLPDKGAYAWQPMASQIQLVDVLQPATSLPLLHDSSYVLTIKIRNTGSNVLTNLQFSYRFGLADTVTEVWSGQLASGDSLLYSFANPLRISSDSVFVPNLKVWSLQLSGNTIPNPQFDTLTRQYCTALSAGTYTLRDTSDAANAIDDWLRLLHCGGVTGPVVLKTDFQNNLLLNPGLVIGNIPGASITNHLVLNGDGDTLRANSTVFQPYISLVQSKHIRIQGFVFDFALTISTHSMLWTQNTEHITLVNNHFLSRSTFGLRSAVRAMAYLSNPSLQGNSYHLRIDSNRFEGPFSKVVELMGNINGVHHHVNIRYNHLLRTNSGIWVQFVDTGEIAFNDISINNIQPPNHVVAGIAMDGQNSELRIHNNKIHSFQTQGMFAELVGIYVRSRTLIPASKNYLFNNLIFDLHGVRSQIGIYASRTDSLDIVNNTIYLKDTTGVLATYGIWLDTSSTANVWNNNISILPLPGANAAALRFNLSLAVRFNFNNYHIAISNPLTQYVIQNSNGRFSSLNTYQQLYPQFDAQSHSTLPVFKDVLTQDFVPMSPLLYRSGRIIPYVTTDFRGVNRPAVPSIGALEDSAVVPAGIVLSAFSEFRNENGGTQPQRQVPLEVIVVGSNPIDSLVLRYRKNEENWLIDSTRFNLAGRQVIQRTFGPGLTLRTGVDTLQAIAIAYYGGQAISDTVIRIVQNQFLSVVNVPHSNNFDSLQNINDYQIMDGLHALTAIMGPPGFNHVIQGQSSLVMRAKPNAISLPSGTSMFNAFENAPNHISETKILVNPGRTGKLRVSFRLRMINNVNTNFFRLQVNDSTITAQPGPNVLPIIIQTSNTVLRLNFELDNLNAGVPLIVKLQSIVAPVNVSGSGFACNIIDSLRIYFEPDVELTALSTFNDTLCTPMARNISVTAIPFRSTINNIHLHYNTTAGSWASLPMTANGQPNGYSAVLPPQNGINLVRYAVTAQVSNGLSWTSDTLGFENEPYRVDLGPDKNIFVGQSTSLNTRLVDLGIKGLRITEFQFLRNGQGSQPNYPPGITSAHDDIVELANYGDEAMALDNAELHFIGQSTNSFLIYHFPAGTVLQPFERAIVVLASGTNNPSSKLFFTSHPANVSINYSSGLKGYVVLREKNSTRFLDGLCINDSVFPASMNVPTHLWSGTISGSGRSGIQRINLQEANAQAWRLNSTTHLHTIGSIDSSLQFGPEPQQIRWYAAGGQLLATGDSLMVNPTNTSQYAVEVDWLGCVKTDTIVVQVAANTQPDLSISAILSPAASDTVVLNAPLVARIRVKNLTAVASNGFTLNFTADNAFIGNVLVSQGVAGNDSIDVSLPAWTPDPRSYDLCFNLVTSNDFDSTNNGRCLTDVHFALTISVQDIAAYDIMVYPNPVQEHLYLRTPDLQFLPGQWLAVDATGRRIALPDAVEISPGLMQFSVSQLAAGVYYLQLSGLHANDLQKIKFVVIR